ncbi:MAG: hypothetical protein WC699_15740 [Bacteroidales bacterium]|jgi:hypothetical protein
MKKSTWKISLILGVLTLIMPGCLDIWITTQINADGSLEQTLVFEGDSTEIAGVNFALIKEADWKKEWIKVDKDKHKLVVNKKFSSVKELNKSMNPADTNLLVIRVDAKLHRKFRWFFTRYVFDETVLRANPFPMLDDHKYLSDEEIRLISMTDDRRKADPAYDSIKYKETEKHFEDFLFHSMYEDFHKQLIAVLAADPSLTLTPQALDSQKELIYSTLIDSVKGNTPDDILQGIGLIIDHPDIRTIREKHLNYFERFQEKMKFYESASDDMYKFAIRMPGILLTTNSPKIEGSQTNWELSYYDFFFKDYTLSAESRKVNSWAFIVAGLIVLIALTGLITTKLKKP